MGPIEGLWGSILIIFVFIGLIRGFLKELGVTVVLVTALTVFNYLVPWLENFINKGGLLALGLSPADRGQLVSPGAGNALWFIFTLLTIGAVFVSYQGEVLVYNGSAPKFPVGTLLSLLVGAINGYLFTGTLWWFLNRYNYPVQQFKLIDPTLLTQTAKDILNGGLLPLDLLGNKGVWPTSGPGPIWLPLILIILVVLKVLR